MKCRCPSEDEDNNYRARAGDDRTPAEKSDKGEWKAQPSDPKTIQPQMHRPPGRLHNKFNIFCGAAETLLPAAPAARLAAAAAHGPKRLLYSPEVMKALTISAARKSPPKLLSFWSQKL